MQATYGSGNYHESKSAVETAETALEHLTADNPNQQRLIPSLKQFDAQNVQWAEGQGYLFSAPLPAKQCADLIWARVTEAVIH